MENVNHDVYEIQQGPPSGRDALDVMWAAPTLLQGLAYTLRERPDVRVRRSRGDHEEVGCVAHPPQVEHDNIKRLVRLEGVDREPKILAYAAFDLAVWRLGANGSARPKVPGLRFDRIYPRRRVRCERPGMRSHG